MSDITNPHDKFFKETFGQPEIARDFLVHYLPAQILPLLDLSQIELEKESFIDPELQEHFSDLLYSAPLVDGKGLVFIYLLMEHKSYFDSFTPLQLLGYMVRFWERRGRQGEKSLEPIIPLVLYHGRERWVGGQRLGDLYHGPDELRLYLPDFTYQLTDLSRHSDEEIKGEVLTQIALRLLHAIFDPRLGQQLPEIFMLFRRLANQETALQYLETVLRYLSVTAERITPNELLNTIEGVFKQRGDELMPTLAQQWREEGRLEGRLEGRQEGRREGRKEGLLLALRQAIQDLLEERLAISPQWFQARLAKIDDPDVLRILVRRAATVDSVAEFEQALDTLVTP